MIPKTEYVNNRVTNELLEKYHTKEELERFNKFMFGQTMDAGGIYPWDYERWLQEGKRDEQHPLTWD